MTLWHYLGVGGVMLAVGFAAQLFGYCLRRGERANARRMTEVLEEIQRSGLRGCTQADEYRRVLNQAQADHRALQMYLDRFAKELRDLRLSLIDLFPERVPTFTRRPSFDREARRPFPLGGVCDASSLSPVASVGTSSTRGSVDSLAPPAADVVDAVAAAAPPPPAVLHITCETASPPASAVPASENVPAAAAALNETAAAAADAASAGTTKKKPWSLLANAARALSEFPLVASSSSARQTRLKRVDDEDAEDEEFV